MDTLITIIHFLAAVLLIVLILLQQGKGAQLGASFGGSGSSQSLFGSSGGGTFFSKVTSGLAVVFFVTSLWLTLMAKDQAALNTEDLPFDTGSPFSAPIEADSVPISANSVPAMPIDDAEFGSQPVVIQETVSEADADDVESPPVEMPTE